MTKVMERYAELEKRRIHCKKFLIDKGLTQKEVALKLDVRENFLSDFINGKTWSGRVAEFFEYKRESN